MNIVGTKLSNLFMICSLLVHKFLQNVNGLIRTCTGLVHCLLLTRSWCSWLMNDLIISFINLFDFFPEIFHLSTIHNLFTIFLRHVQLILMTCSNLFHNLLWIVHDLLMTYSWHVHYLFMPCSSGCWLVDDLFMSCSWLVHDLFITC